MSAFMMLRAVADSFDDKSKRTGTVIEYARNLGSAADRLLREKLLDPSSRDWACTLMGLVDSKQAVPHGWGSQDGEFLLWAQWPVTESFLICTGKRRVNTITALRLLELDEDRFTAYCQCWRRTRKVSSLRDADISSLIRSKPGHEAIGELLSVIRYALLNEPPPRPVEIKFDQDDSIEYALPLLRVATLSNPGNLEHAFQLGTALMSCDRYEEGLEALLIASRDLQLRIPALWHAGNAALKVGETRRARSLFRALVRQDECPEHYYDFAMDFLHEFERTMDPQPEGRRRGSKATPPPWETNTSIG